jgi:hypothetical protein
MPGKIEEPRLEAMLLWPIALAKAKGVYKGRKPALNAERIAQCESRWLREQTEQS